MMSLVNTLGEDNIIRPCEGEEGFNGNLTNHTQNLEYMINEERT
jgi:hypothetical protein